MIRTWISAAFRSRAALARMLDFTGKMISVDWARTESLPWTIHWRALKMQGNTTVSATFSGPRVGLSSISSPGRLLEWSCQLLWLSRQRVNMFSTDTLKFCWSERCEEDNKAVAVAPVPMTSGRRDYPVTCVTGGHGFSDVWAEHSKVKKAWLQTQKNFIRTPHSEPQSYKRESTTVDSLQY